MIAIVRSRLIAALVAAIMLLAACGGDTAVFEMTAAGDAQELLAEQPPGLVVLDVRTPDEFAEGHIADATNIDFYEPDFAASLDALDKEKPYFVYCRSGNRSESAVAIMEDLGFNEVYELDGGIISWVEAGNPVEN